MKESSKCKRCSVTLTLSGRNTRPYHLSGFSMDWLLWDTPVGGTQPPSPQPVPAILGITVLSLQEDCNTSALCIADCMESRAPQGVCEKGLGSPGYPRKTAQRSQAPFDGTVRVILTFELSSTGLLRASLLPHVPFTSLYLHAVIANCPLKIGLITTEKIERHFLFM